MAYMEVILRDDMPNLGKSGDLVRVKAGYGRNYLIPKGIAILATKRNKAQMEHEKRVIAVRRAKQIKTAEDLKAKLEELTVSISKKVGKDDKLFGSVTVKEIADYLGNQGFSIDRKALKLEHPIKELGVHNIPVKLDNEVEATLKVWVVNEE